MKTKSSGKIHIAWLKKNKEKKKDTIRLSECKLLTYKKNNECLQGK